jgi:Autotransporter beta-domain
MKQQEFSYRIIKVGKTAVSVAVCSLFAAFAGGAAAESYNFQSSQSFNQTVNTDALDTYYYYGNSWWGEMTSNTLTMTLSAGRNLSGMNLTGGVPLAVSTREVRDGGAVDTVWFSGNNSTLNLQGNNSLTGLVGVHAYLNGNTGGNFYDSVVADPLTLINVNGTNVTFNSDVYASRIEINQGGTLQFYGNVQNNPGYSTTVLDYNSHNASVTLHDGVTLDGSIVKNNTTTNGSLIFTGSATITGSVANNVSTMGLVELRGGDYSWVAIGGNLSADHVDFQAQSVLSVGQDLILNVKTAGGAYNRVTFNDTDGELQIGGNIVGRTVGGIARDAVTTTLNDTGTVTMLRGTQTVVGNLGQDGNSLHLLNIGGTYNGYAWGWDDQNNSHSNTTIAGHVFATVVSLNSDNNYFNQAGDATLNMVSGYNITGDVVSNQDGRGTLTLEGGMQTVTGNVGESNVWLRNLYSGANGASSTITGDVYAVYVGNTGTGTTTFNSNVTATDVDVYDGTSNFVNNVTANTTYIANGTGNFNTNGSGVTNSNVQFYGNGVANLYTGLTGSVNFDGNSTATVNVWDGKTITGDIFTTDNNTGILNFRGNGVIGGQVGNGWYSIKELNVNTNGQINTTNGVLATQSVYATNVNLINSEFSEAVLTMAHNADLTTTAVTTDVNNWGVLRFQGDSTVTGTVGADGAALRSILVGTDRQATVTFNNLVTVQELSYATAGSTVVLNGVGTNGLVGTVNMAGMNNTLQINDLVNLDTSLIAFKNAGDSDLRFMGSSTITGALGNLANTDAQNFRDIYAGETGKTVTFKGDVFLSSTTFHVSGDGIVNLGGNLNGPLVYEANGSVNVANGKQINSGVTTNNDGYGTLNFVGGTTTQAPIGESGAQLYAVNFHADTSDSSIAQSRLATVPVTVNIGHDVYAYYTSIGNADFGATTANITATGKYLGTYIYLAPNTTLNTAGAIFSDAVSPVNFSHTKNADGTLNNGAVVTKSSIGSSGSGWIWANGATTMNFAVANSGWSALNGGGLVATANSSSITGGAGSELYLSPDNKINVSFLGSLRNGANYKLIDVTSGGGSELPSTYRDNSYVMNSSLSRGDNGELIVTVSRNADNYWTKAGLFRDHYSNGAATRLGALAANGTGYSQDLQTVLNKLDVDQWGYGNTQANLQTQVKRLAPIANNSLSLTGLSASSAVADSIGMRMHELRVLDSKSAFDSADVWVKTSTQVNKQKQEANDYDGYTANISSVTVGVDSRPSSRSLVGGALSMSTAKVSQNDFRQGDEATITSYQGTIYGAHDFSNELFVDGQVSFGKLETKGNRKADVDRVAQFNIAGNQLNGKFNLGYRFKLGEDTTTTLTPIFSVESAVIQQDAYTETGAGDIGLNVQAQRLQRTQTALGLRLASTQMISGMVVKPEATLSATRDSGNFNQPITASYIGDRTGTTFATPGADYTANGAKFGLGMGLLMSKSSSVVFRYEYALRGTYTSNAAELVARWNF